MAEEGGKDEGKLVWPLEWAGNEQSVPGPACSLGASMFSSAKWLHDTPSGGLVYGNTRKLLPASVCVLSKVPQPFSFVSVLQAHVCRVYMAAGVCKCVWRPEVDAERHAIFRLPPPPYVLGCIPLLNLGLINSATLAC